MKREWFLIGMMLIVALTAAGCAASDSPRPASQATTTQTPNTAAGHTASTASGAATTANDSQSHDGHSHGPVDPTQVPAFEVSEASLKNLPPTLAPSMFTGKTQQAYQIVKEIPKTIAQLPCYCHCDKGFGHRSLHSCYVDNHASMCAVCVDEVILAYRLEKNEKLKPEQIRERIIAQYSAQGY